MVGELSEADLRVPPLPRKKNKNLDREDEISGRVMVERLFSAQVWMGASAARLGGEGGRVESTNRGGGDESRFGDGNRNQNNGNGNESTDAYYLRMIEANPGDALLFGNYARLLKESHKDAQRAESYFDQAVRNALNDRFIHALPQHSPMTAAS
ncbi:hypothetical protein RJ641_024307 [Dillenia turbinata]|uniref:Uncharacterized protein n=1 Tax=Dillenia turbinata TaxID=194707 RepID=A0AAN8UG91_9MAGN